jgi:hypothetical protein
MKIYTPTAKNAYFFSRLISLSLSRTKKRGLRAGFSLLILSFIFWIFASWGANTSFAQTCPPSALFNLSSNPVCAESLLTLTAQQTGATNYTWDCDGCAQQTNIQGNSSASVSWSTSGVKTIKLIVTETSCVTTQSAATAVVTVNALPSPVINAPSVVCGTQTVNIGTSSSASTYTWNFDAGANAGSTSTAATTVSWSSTGGKNVTLTITDANGCQATNSFVVSVNAVPSISNLTASPASVCVQTNTIITANVSDLDANPTFTWSCDNCSGGPPTTIGPHLLSWNNVGVKTVTLQVQNQDGCLSSLATVAVTVNPLPSSSFALSSNPICQNGTLNLTAAVSGASYIWDCDGCTPQPGNTATPSISWATQGLKNLKLTVTQNGCVSLTSVVVVTVNPLTLPVINAPSVVCGTQVVNIGTSSSASTYTWNFDLGANAGSTSTAATTVSWSSTGGKNVTLTITDANGCQATNSFVVSVNAVPSISNLTASPASVCVQTNTIITANVSDLDANPTFTWSCDNCSGGPPTTIGPHLLSWNNGGVKTVTLQVQNQDGCLSSLATVAVTVNPLPSSSFALSSNPVCQNVALSLTAAQTGASNYSWDCDGCAQQTSILNTTNSSPSVTWSTPGIKTLKLIVTQNGCVSTQSSVAVTVNPQPVASIAGPSSGCVGANYTFSAPAGFASYTWNFAGGGQTVVSGLNTNVLVVSWSSAGAKSVTLQAASGGCASATVTQAITISANPPVPTLTPPANICGAGVNVNFTGTALPPPLPPAALSWDFGLGATPTTFTTPAGMLITISNPTVQWSSAGVKTVKLSAINTAGCATVVTSVVTVNVLPSPPIINAPSVVCGTQTVNIGTSSSASTYTWNFDAGANAGSTSTAATTVSWSSTGGKNVTLTITDANGCQATSSVVVSVNAVPTISSLTASPSSLCPQTNTIITANASDLDANPTFTWSCDNCVSGSPSTIGPHLLSWNSAGVKTVSLQAQNQDGCLSNLATVAVTVNALPSSSFALSSNPICQNGTLNLTAAVGGASNYSWDCDGCVPQPGNTATPSISWTAQGLKNLKLTVTQNGCVSLTSVVVVTVNPLTPPVINAPSVVCGTSSADFVNVSTTALGVYSWNFGSGAIPSTSTNFGENVYWSTTGAKLITLTFTDANGCQATNSQVINVGDKPTATFNLTLNPVCQNAGTILSANYSNLDNAPTYTWDCDGCVNSPSGPGPHTLFWNSAGTKTLTLTIVNSNGCVSSLLTQTVTVIPTPSSNFSFSPASVCLNANVNAIANFLGPATYSWNCDNCAQQSSISSTTISNPILSWTTSGNKSVTLTVSSGGCVSTLFTQTITVLPLPTASINVPLLVCQNEAAQFNASSNFTLVNYTWNFGGGNVLLGNGAGPISVNWTSPGVKTITLSVEDDNGCVSAPSATVTLNVAPLPPPPNISVVPSSICGTGPGNAALISTSASAIVYSWDFGVGASLPGGTGGSQNSVHWSGAGTKIITLEITAANSCKNTATQAVQVYSSVPTPSLSSNSPVCGGGTLALTGPAGFTSYIWSGPNGFAQTTNNPNVSITNVSASNSGLYTLAVVDDKGCSSATASAQVVVVNSLQQPIISANATQLCVGQALTLNVINPTTGATYTWNSPTGSGFASSGSSGSVASVTTASAGNYTVTASLTGCSSLSATIAISVNAPPAAPNPTNNGPLCQGATLELSATASAGATYQWSGPAGAVFIPSNTALSPTINAVTTAQAGVYTITVTRPGCPPVTGTTSVQIFAPPAPPQIITNAPVCQGETLSLSIANPIAGATYSWQGPSNYQATGPSKTIPLVSNLEAGVYSATVTLAPCPSATGFSQPVVVNTPPSLPNVSGNFPVCVGNVLSFTVINPSNGATYSWSGPGFNATGVSVSGAAPSNPGVFIYSVTALVPGCSSLIRTTNVTVSAPVTSLTHSPNQAICEGGLLSLTALAAPNFNNIRYEWSGPNNFSSTQQNPFFANIPVTQSGVYSVTASTPGCPGVSSNLNVSVNPSPTAVSLTSNSPVCVGKEIRLTASNVTGATEYRWAGPSGFTQTTAAPSLIIPAASGQNSGVFTLTVVVGGCTNTVSNTATVTVLDPASVTITSNAPICAGQELLLEASSFSGVQNVNYVWNGPGGYRQNGAKLNIKNAPTLFSGVYTLTVEIPGCATGTQTVTATINPSPSLPFPTNNGPVCVGGELRLSAISTSGAFYQWSGPGGFAAFEQNPVISGANLSTASAGVYSVTVNLGGCTRSGTTSVIVNQTLPSGYVLASNGPICTTEDLRLTAQSVAGATYTWKGPNGFTSSLANPVLESVTSAAIGVYSLSVNLPGCGVFNFTIAPTIRLTPDLPTITSNSPICEGGTLQLSATSSPGAQFVWVGPLSFASSLRNPTIAGATTARSGTYSVTAVIEGCAPKTSVANVVVNPAPEPVITSNSPVCQGNTLNLRVELIAEAKYQWLGPGQFSSSLQNPSRANIQSSGAGVYTLSVTVPGCDPVIRTHTVTVNAPPPSVQPGSNSPVCQGGTLQLNAPSVTNAIYQWTGPNGFVSTERNPKIEGATADAAGSYSLIVQREGCPGSSGVVNVSVIALPTDVNATNSGPVCVGASLTLSATSFAGATYEWRGPAGFSSTEQNPSLNAITASRAGVYTVSLRVQGCSAATRTTQVTVNAYPPNLAISSNSPVCEGDILTLTAPFVTNATYLWDGPDGFTATTASGFISSVTTANSGVYSVTLNLPGCGARTLQARAQVNAGLNAIRVSSNSPVCEGGVLSFTLEGAASNATFNWSGPQGFSSTQQNPSLAGAQTANSGLYQVAILQPGCGTTVFNAIAQVNPGLNSFRITSNAPICAGGVLRLTVPSIPGATYEWRGPSGFTSSSPNPSITNITSAAEGIYNVSATIPACGVVTDNVEIRVSPSLQNVTISSNAPVCAGGVLNLSAPIIEGASYRWTGPGGFISTEARPRIENVGSSYSGVYTLTLSSSGCGTRVLQTSVTVVEGNNLSITANEPICAGQTLILSVPDIAGATYAWSGPNNFSGAQARMVIPNVSLNAAGLYSVTATIPACGVVTASRFIAVNTALSNIVASNNGPVCAGGQLLLSANGGAGLNYSWTGPNGFRSTLQNPILNNITTGASGIYTVTVSSPGCGVFNATTNVVVNPAPSDILAVNNGPLCTNGILVLNATFVPGASYNWSGPRGFSSTEVNPRISGVTPENSGSYNVSIFLPGCGLVTRTTNVVVSPSLIDLNISNNSPVCEESAINLSVASVPGATYLWSGPRGFTSTQNAVVIPNATFANAGEYSVEIVSPSCGNIRLSTLVTVKPKIGEVELRSNSPICEGENLNLSATSRSDVSYAWSGPGNFSSTSASVTLPSATSAASGVYTLTVSSLGCNPVTLTTSVTVNRGSRVASVSAPVPAAICPGGEVTFDITFEGAGPWDLVYRQANGPIVSQSVSANPSRVTLAPASNLALEYSFGCNGISRSVGAQPPLNASLERKVEAICGAGGSATIAVANPGPGLTFRLQGSNTAQTSGGFTGLAPGNYTVIITNEAGCLEAISFTILNESNLTAPGVGEVTTNSITVNLPQTGVNITAIEYRAVGVGTGFASLPISPGQNSRRIEGLLSNTLYEFRLVGNCPGSSAVIVSNTVSARTSDIATGSEGVCQTPALLPVEVLSNTSVRLRWVPNQSGAVCYVISYGLAESSVDTWQTFLVTHPLSEVILTGLNPGRRYGFRIRTNCTLCSTRSGIFTPFSSVVFSDGFSSKQGAVPISSSLIVYPNPSKGIFNLSWELDNLNPLHLRVVDFTGRVVFEQAQEPISMQWDQVLELERLPAGLYFLEIRQGGRKERAQLQIIK